MAISNLYPAEGPTLNLNFANSRILDRRITFERTTGGTYTDRDGLIKTATVDEPRFDHRYQNGQVESLGLLIEEGITNLVNHSTYFSSGSSPRWVNIFPATATITTGIDAPDGTNTAVRLTCNNSGNSLLRVEFDGFTPNGTDSYTASFYVRKISGTTAAGNQLICDLHDGGDTIQKNYLPELVTNQWVRVVATGVPSNSLKTFFDLLSDRTTDYVLDFWGLQIEQKAFATSYIPTSGSQGIRSADRAYITGTNFSDWYNPDEGTIYTRAKSFANSTELTGVFSLNIPTNFAADRVDLRYNQSSSSRMQFNNSSIQRDSGFSYSFPKFAIGYKLNTQKFAIDGNLISGTQGFVPSQNITHLQIGTFDNFSHDLNGHISQLTYYRTLLSDIQIQTLTK